MTHPAVAIVEDHPIIADSLAGHLTAAGWTVTAQVATVEDPGLGAPDLVICDLRLPGRSGAEAIGFLAEAGLTVLACSGSASGEEVLDVIAAGARGFVPKTADIGEFVSAAGAIAAGGRHLSSELAGWLRTDARRRPLADGDIGGIEDELLSRVEQGDPPVEAAHAMGLTAERYDELLNRIWAAATRRRRSLMPTAREREVMGHVAAGLSHKDIARLLGIRPVVVPDHLTNIKRKYVASHPDASPDIKPTVAAAKWAAELGLA